MVKIGFICEGITELILLQSDPFKHLVTSLNLELVQVINAEGSGNLLPHNITEYIAILEKNGAETIFILTDLDEDICITETKKRISARKEDMIIVAVKKIEAWFLACNTAMNNLLEKSDFHFPAPEKEKNPFDTINYLLHKSTGRGIGKKAAGKIKLVNRLLGCGLDLSQSALYPNCPSASYFLNKLKHLSAKNSRINA